MRFLNPFPALFLILSDGKERNTAHWLVASRCVGGLAICPTYAGRFSRNGDLSRRFADTHDAAASLRP